MEIDIRQSQHEKFNKSLAAALKEMPEFESPEWIVYVKTSVHKQRPTLEEDFWFIRAASILRQISIRKVVGVSRLRTRYGGSKNRGSQPSAFKKGAGKIIRVILQQAEKAGLVEKVKGNKSGRQLTAKGKELLTKVSQEN